MIKNIVVLGAGTMAMGIALEAARYGYSVDVWYRKDVSAPYCKLDKMLKKYLAVETMEIAEAEEIRSRIRISNDLGICSRADLVIESIAEDLGQKIDLFQKISPLLKDECILCTNTSSLSIQALCEALPHKSRFAGLHFFNPVNRMKLVEIVHSDETHANTLDHLKDFVYSLKKEPVQLKDSPGFIVNRLLLSYLNHAVKLYTLGIASMEDIDLSMRFGANHPVGPFSLCDMIGIDVIDAALTSLYQQLQEESFRPDAIFGKMVKEGKLGKKTGQGFYTYTR